jgi:hypothetical protein
MFSVIHCEHTQENTVANQDLPFLVDQTLTQVPKFYLAFGDSDARLSCDRSFIRK